MSLVPHQGSRRMREGEDAAIRHVIERLRQQFPEIDHDTVARTVHGHYDKLADAPVRDFIPVLTERATRAGLRTAAAEHNS